MSEAIKQCERDIAKLQKELKRLKAIEPKHGDIVECDGYKRIIIEQDDGFHSYSQWGHQLPWTNLAKTVETCYALGTYKVIGNLFKN